jgi:hypothetical protein
MLLRSVRSALTVAALLLPALAGAQNRALGRPAFGSGDYDLTYSAPGHAVDGNTNGVYGNGSTFHSSTSINGWWYVQLDQAYDITQIDFWNRTDCCTGRIVGATLGIFTAAPYGVGSPAPVWSTVFSSGATHQVFTPPAVSGSYVGIRAASSGDSWLQIAELEVYGSPTGVSAVPEPATVALVGGGLLALAGIARRRRV